MILVDSHNPYNLLEVINLGEDKNGEKDHAYKNSGLEKAQNIKPLFSYCSIRCPTYTAFLIISCPMASVRDVYHDVFL